MKYLPILFCILLFSCDPPSQYRLSTYYSVPDSLEGTVEECTKSMLKELSSRTVLDSDDMEELLVSSHNLCIRNYSRGVPSLDRAMDGRWMTIDPKSLTKVERDTLAELMWGKTLIDRRTDPNNQTKP